MDYIETVRPIRLGRIPTNAALYESRESQTHRAVEQLRQAVDTAQEVLVRADTVFPFTLFPDTVVVDREKITVSHRFFFRVAEVMSIGIDDILNVAADVGPLFGALKVTTRFYNEKKPYSVNYLWRSDALAIKQLLQGYIIARKKNVDLEPLPTSDLRTVLTQLGQGAPENSES
ncbi:MAG TPA: hypothetical protein VLF91_05425 [Candidatus Saccharimonadales bacterium]|nr:hypothetical protein [Candidatus Saccharimonadales bacterium]